MSEYQISVSAYDVSNNFVKKEKEEREKEVNKVIEGIRIAKKLQTIIVRVFCGDLYGDISFADGKQWIIEGLEEAAKCAEVEGVFLAIENHGLLTGKSEQVKEIIESVKCKYVLSTFDTGNFLLVGENSSNAFATLKNEIIHVHLKDFQKNITRFCEWSSFNIRG